MQMHGGVMLDPTRYWYCPECPIQHVTKILQPCSPLHFCTSSTMRGAMTPLVERGVKARLRINRREDYQGTDILTTDGEGRPVMSITTQRDDGEDCHAFAPCIQVPVAGLSRS